MLSMCGHVSDGFFAVTSYSCKVNTMVFVILLQVCKVNFLNRQQILITRLKASKFATDTKIHENHSIYLARIGCHSRKSPAEM